MLKLRLWESTHLQLSKYIGKTLKSPFALFAESSSNDDDDYDEDENGYYDDGMMVK